MYKIYTLSDPSTLEIRYVGVTTRSLNERLSQHKYDAKHKPTRHVLKWINSLPKDPVIELLDLAEYETWELYEQYWISQLRQWGIKLTNHSLGGKGVIKGVREKSVKSKYKKIEVYDFQGKYIATYSSITEAALNLNILKTSICNALHTKREYSPLIKNMRFLYEGSKGKSFIIYRAEKDNMCIVSSNIPDLCSKIKVCRSHISYKLKKGDIITHSGYVIYKDIVYSYSKE